MNHFLKFTGVVRIAIFASGGGSNAEKIIQYFEKNSSIEVGLVVTNNKNAGVLAIADRYHIASCVISKQDIYESNHLLEILNKNRTDLLVLAGFLWLIPESLIKAYAGRIINIHPSLLPKYGGKGMYGHHVHEAVKADQAEISGMTVHLVNEKYDDGAVIFQKVCELKPEMNANQIAAAVLKLEHQYYSEAIENYIKTHFNTST
jgi:phosphoribosylglycinamide formyltransferase 1